jgi:hypothetical protein
MTVRNHPAGQPARTRISHLVMLALLAGASGQAAADLGPNLNPDGSFRSGWVFGGPGGTISLMANENRNGFPIANEACIPVMSFPLFFVFQEVVFMLPAFAAPDR